MLAHKKEDRPKSLEILKYLTNSQNLNNILKNGVKNVSFLIEGIKKNTETFNCKYRLITV